MSPKVFSLAFTRSHRVAPCGSFPLGDAHHLCAQMPARLRSANGLRACSLSAQKRNRICRFDAAHVLDVLRRPPLKVARARLKPPAHTWPHSLRASVSSTASKDAYQRLDSLTARLIPTQETEAGSKKAA
jgi:hypothetical protein